MRLTVPTGALQVNQLHQEILAAFPALKGARQSDGTYLDPRLAVRFTETQLTLDYDPRLVTESDLLAVLAAHTPGPSASDRQRREHAKKPSTLSLPERVARVEIVLGLDG